MHRILARTGFIRLIGLKSTLRSHLIVTAAIMSLAAVPAASGQTTWYVDDDAPADPGPGDPTVSDPLEDGSADHPFDAIQEGIDAATDGDTILVADGTYTGLGNKDLDYDGKAITVRSESGPDNCVIDCERDGRGFYFHSDETATSVVDGLTIASGDVDDGSSGGGYGGGINCYGSSPTITNCVIRGNEAQYEGGGIVCDYSDAVLSNCVIVNNRLARLGYWGGGIHCYDGNPTIADCVIKSNAAPYYGGGISCQSSSPDITGCTITENVADIAGGGIRCSYESDPVIRNCVISGNVARGDSDDHIQGGAGVYCNGSSPTLVNSVIVGNTAVASGGGIVIFNWYEVSMPTIVYCVISGNSADDGGGVYVASGTPTIINSVVRANTPEQIGLLDDQPEITYCNIEGGWAGEGNIDADPLFAFDDDYRILSASPCIDAGTNDVPGGVLWEDIDGNTRLLDGDGDGTAVADIGIHEFTGEVPSIALSTREIEFFVHDDALIAEQALVIRNCGGATLDWNANASCPWLMVDPSSGSSGGDANEVAVSVDATGLSHGKYACDLSLVDSNAANSPQTVHVILHVATTLHVPTEYATIGAAVDAATVAGDVVLVADGVYAGEDNKNLDLRGRAITVCSENGAWNCIINCAGGGRAFNFENGEGETSIVRGFTITGGYADFGAAIRCYGYCEPTISNCLIIGNRTVPSNPGDRGGGVFCRYHASPTITNCMLIGNQAESGGGVYVSHESSPLLTNCTITANTEGSGVYLQESEAVITNCILWANTPEQLTCEGDWWSLGVGYSNIEGGWEGEGNIDADLLFAFAADPHLLVDSPCIDAGTNDPPGGLPPTDLGGNARPIDGDEDGVAVADMGACEFDPARPAIALSPVTLEFYVAEDQADTLDQALFIRNSGTGVLEWSVVPSDPRVTVDPASGDSSGETDEVTVTLDPEGMSHGSHFYALEVSGPQAANSPRLVAVIAHVAGTLRVPADYSTIQDAIDAATEPNDVVLVADGVYAGAGNRELSLYGRAITVRSENGADNCTIDCENEGRGFIFQAYEDARSLVQGFTITNGYQSYGAGICCYDYSSPTITGCTITGNTASRYGGAIYCYNHSSPTITDCTMTGNAANSYAGGICCRSLSSPVIAGCVITQNVADDDGGGICCRTLSNPVITACVITQNVAGEDGGGVCCFGTSNPTIAGCTIEANVASLGGGAFCAGSQPAITNCTIRGNAADEGGGIFSSNDGSPTIANSILWGNEPDEIVAESGSPVVTHCDVEGGWSGNGNIDADPLFVDPNNGDCRLSAGSPCIDAGCNCAVSEDLADLDGDGDTEEYVPFDMDGEGRFFDDPDTPDSGSGVPPIVDMGAYEFGGSDFPPCRGDLDGDHGVDLQDLVVLLGHYGMTSGASGADGDMDCDGDVELSDLADLLGTYGTVCD